MSRAAPLLALLALAACHSRAGGTSPLPAGLYSGETPSPGLVQLQVAEGGRAELVNLVTLHLPPAELERHAAKLVRNEAGQLCLEPPPTTAKPCLETAADGALLLILQPEDVRVRLVRVEGGSEPPPPAR